MSSAKRASTVSFSKSESEIVNEPDHISDNDDEVQLSMSPCVQEFLAQVSQDSGCWGRMLPMPFERAAGRSWWDPTFDSEILEDQYRKSVNTHNRVKFRFALWYILLLSFSWFIYFLATGINTNTHHWPVLCSVLAALILSTITVLLLTYTEFYNVHMLTVSLMVALALCTLNLTIVVLLPMRFDEISDMSPAGHFSICIEILLLIYTVIPLRLYMCISIGILYSITFEVLIWSLHGNDYHSSTAFVRILSHVCIHLIGLHISIMTNVRMRNTFMKVGQSLLVRRQLESEKQLKENMIHSLMPSSVANWLSRNENFTKNGDHRQSNPETNDIQSLFRPFNMNRMENVSILFADIVGFTKMASTKSADQLVEILNRLFQKFDLLCKFHGCEKISTLGDCYYCVSGCPEPKEDHAKCCVEMGLSMIQAIRMFEQEKHEGINMRVGVHTGTILCGIVGTRRFKFDVWSNDVTFANRMESTGKPGMVHISEKTKSFLPDMYFFDEGEPVFGLKTYFILGKKSERPPSYNGSFKAIDNAQNSLQLIVSPPTSPPSMSPQTRPRVLSCDTSSTYMKPLHNPNQLSPDVCKIKASSLPSILDSDNEQDEAGCKGEGEIVKTPTSTASSGRYSVKLKKLKVPKFLRKSDQKDIDAGSVVNTSNSEEPVTSYSGYQQVPTIIETQNGHMKELDSWNSMTHIDDDKYCSIYLDEQKDTIDVKSYISQSRSDIGQYDIISPEVTHFMRSGSYRSNYGRTPDFSFLNRAGSNRSRREKSPNIDLVPAERARSATVAVGNSERPKKTSLEVPSRLSTILIDDQFSTDQSVNSRKDSGIKSNSRRSSIQMENQVPPSEHRVSGYYTSSQSSIITPQYVPRLPGPQFGNCVQTLRKQSDRQLIKCVQDNSRSKRSYFIKPPLSKISLFFKNKKMEKEYRANVHSIAEQTESIPTIANSRYNTYFDVLVSALVFFIVSACLFIINVPPKMEWKITFSIFILVQICAVALCFERVYKKVCSRWYRWNAFGGVLVGLPLIAVLVNFSIDMSDYLYTYLIFIGIIHFSNFTQLNCWMKNILATIFGITFISLILTGYCDTFQELHFTNFSTIDNNASLYNAGPCITNCSESHQRKCHPYDTEIFMDLLLLLFLVWVLNREFEIAYRISFHAHYVANRDKNNVHYLKNQADWLIYNIVPEHVAEQLKQTAKYSENFKDVGIIFASVVNFNEMYDESYLGGREFLRVLNELIGDFDELLTFPQYHCVEKIKTIGSTFMAASGLNSKMRKGQVDKHEHLYALMDFARDMQIVINKFNSNLLEFELILRIGYNFGDVTAAVIGKTKLYYDIWGDAVNIASRMDSTGLNGKIQVGEHCLEVLEKRFMFEKRGEIYVKGKDIMSVYLLKDDNDMLGVPQ